MSAVSAPSPRPASGQDDGRRLPQQKDADDRSPGTERLPEIAGTSMTAPTRAPAGGTTARPCAKPACHSRCACSRGGVRPGVQLHPHRVPPPQGRIRPMSRPAICFQGPRRLLPAGVLSAQRAGTFPAAQARTSAPGHRLNGGGGRHGQRQTDCGSVRVQRGRRDASGAAGGILPAVSAPLAGYTRLGRDRARAMNGLLTGGQPCAWTS